MSRGAAGYRATIDGLVLDFSPRLKQQEAELLNYQKMCDEIQKILAREGLELSLKLELYQRIQFDGLFHCLRAT